MTTIARINPTIKASKPLPPSRLPIAVIDCETDPFSNQYQELHPFAWGFYDGITYHQTWGVNATDEMLSFLSSHKQAFQIFAHNGGRFDFQFMLQHLRGKPLVINGRIVNVKLFHHTLSDSYARIPVPLARFQGKIDIDYSKMAVGKREKHKAEISTYLKSDCISLFDVITAWSDKFGRRDSTMASAAMRKCLEAVPSAKGRMNEGEDEKFRCYYFGGRVQAFKRGIVQDNITLSDANSMYPYAMVKFKHPVGTGASWRVSLDIDDDTDFACIEAWSKGALPLRTDTGLHFPSGFGTFYATGHEIRMGLRHNRLKISKVLHARTCKDKVDFSTFINPVYADRMIYKRNGDVMNTEFYKLLMNSAYGKFAINPRNFMDFIFIGQDELDDYEVILTPNGREINYEGKWYVQVSDPSDTRAMLRFKRPADNNKGYRNVATAASITGAARAVLFECLCKSQHPIYCDTDSIAARCVETSDDPYTLGAWKVEAFGDAMAIAGKKMYALFGEPANDAQRSARMTRYGDARCIKLASKGVRLTAPEMVRIANEGEIFKRNEAPTFDVDGQQFYIGRTVRLTNDHMILPFPDEMCRADWRGGLERISA